MVKKWVDVNEGDWFYNDVMEATNTILEDGQPFVNGIAYNTFEAGKPYIYDEIVAEKDQTVFKLSKRIEPDNTNPLYVFIDGVQTIYRGWSINSDGTTDVELYSGVQQGQIVSFVSVGVPKVDPDWKKPVASYAGEHPSVVVPMGDKYFYDPFSRSRQEYLYAYGRMLKRANVPTNEWNTSSDLAVAKKYIAYSNDVYAVNPNTGKLLLPYNLNGVTCTFNYWVNDNGNIYMKSEKVKGISNNISHNDRFFPHAIITRAEAFALINRLRKALYARFTDMDAPTGELDQEIVAYQGQTVFRINGNYPAGKNLLQVYLNGTRVFAYIHYTEFDNHTVLMKFPVPEGSKVRFVYKKTTSSRFEDVGKEAGYEYPDGSTKTWGADAWWVQDVFDLEDETFLDGEMLINGMKISNVENGMAKVDKFGVPTYGNNPQHTWFMPETALTRAETVAILNRFRKWSIERFK